MPLEWPSTIKVVTNGIELDAVTLDGGEPLEGPPQVEATASEHWNGSIEVAQMPFSDVLHILVKCLKNYFFYYLLQCFLKFLILVGYVP